MPFVDEPNGAAPDVQEAFYSLILDRRLGEYELPPESRVVGAGNREDRALVRPLSPVSRAVGTTRPRE